MTLERREGELVITRLPVEQMALLSMGAALSAEAEEVLRALLRGERVRLLESGLEYKDFRKSAPLGVYRKFIAMERELREMGILVARDRHR